MGAEQALRLPHPRRNACRLLRQRGAPARRPGSRAAVRHSVYRPAAGRFRFSDQRSERRVCVARYGDVGPCPGSHRLCNRRRACRHRQRRRAAGHSDGDGHRRPRPHRTRPCRRVRGSQPQAGRPGGDPDRRPGHDARPGRRRLQRPVRPVRRRAVDFGPGQGIAGRRPLDGCHVPQFHVRPARRAGGAGLLHLGLFQRDAPALCGAAGLGGGDGGRGACPRFLGYPGGRRAVSRREQGRYRGRSGSRTDSARSVRWQAGGPRSVLHQFGDRGVALARRAARRLRPGRPAGDRRSASGSVRHNAQPRRVPPVSQTRRHPWRAETLRPYRHPHRYRPGPFSGNL